MKRLITILFLFSSAYAQIITNKGVITNPVPIANGGTNNASLSVTSGTMYVADGTKLVGITPGTSSQILHGGTTPLWQDTTAISASTGWSILGNTGTSRSVNFMGSTDNVAVSFRQNNIFRMQLDTNGRSQLFVGNRPGIVWPGKTSLLIWDTLRQSPTYDLGSFGIQIIKEVYKLAGDVTAGQIIGIASEPRINGANTANWTSTLDAMIGGRFTNNIQSGATGTIAYTHGIVSAADIAAMTITNRDGLYIENPVVSGTGVITTNKALVIKNQTAAALTSNNYGLYSESYNNAIALAAQLPSGGTSSTYALQVVATQASTPPANQYGVDFQITSAGSDATFNAAQNNSYLAGYTGSAGTAAIKGDNVVAGTGTQITGFSHNSGAFLRAIATTTGTNIASYNQASAGVINVGTASVTITAKNSGVNASILGFALNTGTSPGEIAGGFFLQGTDPTLTGIKSAILGDNGAEAANILTLRDNATTVVSVVDGGHLLLNTTTDNSWLTVNGSFATAYVAKTGTYTATESDYTIDCTSGTFTVTLPTAVGISGRIYVIKNSGAGTITVGTTSSQTIDGVTTQTLSTQYSSYTIQSNNANWIIL